MEAAVDSNVLLDLLTSDPTVSSSAAQTLLAAVDQGPVVICPVVYAELAVGFEQRQELTRFLGDLGVQLEGFSPEALWRTAAAWKGYLRQRRQQVQCPRCGQRQDIVCPACHSPIAWRQHLITDFLIGGHAATEADHLITRDRGYFRTYFPQLQLTVPTAGDPDSSN